MPKRFDWDAYLREHGLANAEPQEDEVSEDELSEDEDDISEEES